MNQPKPLAGSSMTTLCLYTASFPYGLGEQFLETEIKYLAAHFKTVYIIPNNPTGTLRPIPDNVKVLTVNPAPYTTIKGLNQLGRWVFSNLKDFTKAPDKKYYLSNLLRTAYQAKILYGFLAQHNLTTNALHYTYWFNEQSTLLAILKSQNKITRYISRAHRFDLYEERNKNGYIPFRAFQLRQVSKLFLISQHGLNYITEKYPQYQNKFQVSYLGVGNNTPFKYQPPSQDNYHIVSCSRAIEIKRVHLLVAALSTIKTKTILWSHIGDGQLLNQIKDQAKNNLPSNIRYEFLGHIDNSEIFSFYNKTHIDLFINVSSSEGLPVTIMEATSFGIPIIATNVGGTSEIVNSQTGVLIDENPKVEDISQKILMALNNLSRSKDFREGVYYFWNSNFNAKNNYQKFTNELVKFLY